MHDPTEPPADDPTEPERRRFLAKASSVAMGGGLVAGYGGFAAISARYLYPAHPDEQGWLFVTDVASMAPGQGLLYRAPNGATVNIARQGNAGGVDDFVALSRTCPHLGCQVHWQAVEGRFFCPCHNGTFDRKGVATGGPPAEAELSLPRYALDLRGGLLFIRVPVA